MRHNGHHEFKIRTAGPEDAPVLFDLVKGLAEYEKLTNAVTGNAETLARHMSGERPYVEALLAEEADGAAVGFAIYFTNYSTFLTRPGLYLEDIFVLPERRGRGIGRALIGAVAAEAARRGCGRMEWSVLDWNEPAINFYRALGASVLPDWRICRLDGAALAELGMKKETLPLE